MISEAVKQNFYKLFIPITESGCWVWEGATTPSGYGMSFTGKTRRAHRLSWEIHCGPCGGLDVLHRCDVRSCVNPTHLFLGTQTENNADMVRKGRQRSKPRLTHCKHGHEFTTENTKFIQGGKRCMTCAKVRRAAYVANAKALGMTYGYSCDIKPRYRRR